MTKSRIRRTGSGYKAGVAWVTRPGTGMPNRHSERHAGNIRRVRDKKARLTSRGLRPCPEHRTTARATGREEAGEVSRGHSSPTGRRAESSNARSRRSSSMNAEQQKRGTPLGDGSTGGTRGAVRSNKGKPGRGRDDRSRTSRLASAKPRGADGFTAGRDLPTSPLHHCHDPVFHGISRAEGPFKQTTKNDGLSYCGSAGRDPTT